MLEEPSIVNAAFVSQYGEGRTLSRVDRLNKRNEVAKKLVTSTYKHLVAGLEARAKATHKNEVKEWSLELDNVEQAEDVNGSVSVHHPPAATNAIRQCTRFSFLSRPSTPQTHQRLLGMLCHSSRRLCGSQRR